VDSQPNMYAEAKTWNPFKGCEFGCTYCVPSFQRQSKRQKALCLDCYNYTPHCHAGPLEEDSQRADCLRLW
jgi:protein gp37